MKSMMTAHVADTLPDLDDVYKCLLNSAFHPTNGLPRVIDADGVDLIMREFQVGLEVAFGLLQALVTCGSMIHGPLLMADEACAEFGHDQLDSNHACLRCGRLIEELTAGVALPIHAEEARIEERQSQVIILLDTPSLMAQDNSAERALPDWDAFFAELRIANEDMAETVARLTPKQRRLLQSYIDAPKDKP